MEEMKIFDTHLLAFSSGTSRACLLWCPALLQVSVKSYKITFTFLLEAHVPALLGRSSKKINFANSNTIFQANDVL